jgi:hypothetical protein
LINYRSLFKWDAPDATKYILPGYCAREMLLMIFQLLIFSFELASKQITPAFVMQITINTFGCCFLGSNQIHSQRGFLATEA